MQPLVSTRTVVVCLWLGLVGAAASGGQTVYRCGPAGNQYSALPCEDGRPIDVGDRRSAEQIADAHKAVAAQRRLALAMAGARKEAERATPPAQAGALGPLPVAASPKLATAPKAKPASRKSSAKAGGTIKSGEDFVAIVPASGKPATKKKKTQP